jgi:hypothetical protein
MTTLNLPLYHLLASLVLASFCAFAANAFARVTALQLGTASLVTVWRRVATACVYLMVAIQLLPYHFLALAVFLVLLA